MEFRIITYNVNGIRAAIKKGFIDWLRTNPADVICLQEIKARDQDINKMLIEDTGYHVYTFSAERRGYSGVAILSRRLPEKIVCGNQNRHSDEEGRMIRADYGDISVMSVYFPSGTSGAARQDYKYQWLDAFLDYLKKLRRIRKQLIICGDYNIAHREIDIHNPGSNKNASGFLPEERAWMDRLFENGFTDSFRHLNKDPHQYTWWYQLRKSLRIENKGWRIDYISVTDNLRDHIRSVAIYPEVKHSDHCPVFLSLQL